MIVLRRIFLLVAATALLHALVAHRFGAAENLCSNLCEEQGSSSWFPDINFPASTPTSISVSWTECIVDVCGTDVMYIVQYRQKGSSDMYETIEHLNETNVEITGLQSQTQYEVQVCLQENATNCGKCVRCFETPLADEPPSPPRDVMAEGSSPQSITVTFLQPIIWNTLSDITYNVTFHPVGDMANLSFIQFSAAVKFQKPGREERLLEGLEVDTEYEIVVTAINDFGSSLPSDSVRATTKVFTDDAGALLLANSTDILYYQVNDVTVAQAYNPVVPTERFLHTFPASVRGITYHFYRPNASNLSEIYVTLDSGEIRKLTVAVDKDVDNVKLTVIGSDTLVYSVSDEYELGRLNMDWVYNILYWVEIKGNFSRIRRLGLDGGVPEQVGSLQDGIIRDIFPDPFYGYFYWLVEDSHLSRVPISAIMDTTDPSFDLYSLESREELFNSTGEPFITTFTIDLIDLNLVYVKQASVFLVSLSGTQMREYFLGDDLNPLPLITSYQDYAFSYLLNFFVLTRLVLPFANTVDNQDTSEHVDLLYEPTANAMFRGSLQPLPVPPTAPNTVRVKPTTDSVTVMWQAPQFFGSIHGESAFSDWDYEVIYGLINDTSSLSSVGKTNSLSQLITGLTPETTYWFQVIASGPGGNMTTPTLAFTTMTVTNETLRLLVAANPGVFETNLDGEAMYIQRGLSDRSNGTVYDSIVQSYFWVVDNTAGGNLFVATSLEDNGVQSILEHRNNPFALSLDWIGRNLYWVEGDSNRLVTVPFSNISDEAVELFASEEFITDIAIDSLNGLVFWTSKTGIKARTINGLFELDCASMEVPRALTVDASRQRLYYLMVNSTRVVTLGQIEYTVQDGCCCRVEHILPKFSLQYSQTISMVYAAGILFITQYSSTVIYYVPADLNAIDSSTTVLAVGEVRPTLQTFIPEQFRDVSAILDSTQPLPAGLSPVMIGDVPPEIPVPIPQPMDNGSTSNMLRVSWDPIPLEFSPVFYVLQYNLSKPNGTIVSGEITTMNTTLELLDQLFYTEVNLELRAFSLWSEANGTSTATFLLPPQVPAKVRNVRVYVYFPHRNSPTVSAQVVWDGLSTLDAGGVVEKYVITVRDSNGLLITTGNVTGKTDGWDGPPFEVDGDRTEFSLAIFGHDNFLFYPLTINQSYTLDVFAMNAAGNGEKSDVVSFNTTSATPPLEVLQIGSGGGVVVGEGNASESNPVRPPAAIDSVNRFMYYVDDGNVLSRLSLDSNAETQFVYDLPSDLSPLALAYDWLGEAVYVAGRSVEGTYVVWKVSANSSAGFPSSEFYRGSSPISSMSATSLVVNPFTGLLHWTRTDPSSNELFRLDLRDNTSVVSLLQSSRRRRNILSSLVPTSALTQDPETGRLWLSDQSSGNIVSCATSPNMSDCQTEVDASALGSGATGLPADSIVLDEQHIYWSNEDNPFSVFYVLRSDPSLLNILTSPAPGSVILTLSPGQQPLPPAVESSNKQISMPCLSPDPQITLRTGAVTNSSIFISWDEPPFPTECEDFVFSYPPVMYMVNVHDQMDHLPGSPATTNEPMLLVDNLQPFTKYSLEAAGVNQYTMTSFHEFGPELHVYTLEGVPLPVELQSVAYSPRHMYLYWKKLNETALRGNVTNQEFIVDILGVITEQQSTNKQVDGLDRGTQFNFTVRVNNTVLVSPPAVAVESTFLRPPFPEATAVQNTSLTCQVYFDPGHVQIAYVMVNISRSNNSGEILESMDHEFNGNSSYNFTFSGLLAFTNYSLVTVVQYQAVEAGDGTILGPEMDYSEPNFVLTDEGVPNAPVATVDMEKRILSWDRPRENGQPIISYTVDIMNEMGEIIDSRFETGTELSLDPIIEDDGEYNLTVSAMNMIGRGPASNGVAYQVDSPLWGIGETGLIIIGAGAFVVLAVLCVSLIICYCCFISYRSKSVSIGGDYELNRLRALAAHSHSSANPHYMWSRDDYKCTDEDMEQLTKFPRSKLHLETFIDRGEFGEVYQGSAYDILGNGTGPTPVAVKTLRKGSTPDEHMKFLSEAHLQSQFNHQNIVKVLGVCIDNDPIYIIMELMPAGDLLKFLRDAKRDHGPALLTLSELIQIALDVAQGCRYLEQQHFIHRDIAARNCLVSSKGADRVVKIGDFGLAKDLYSSDYYQVEGQRKLPVRWMAPEALLQGKFVIESDIWSYGVLLWEIMTLGNQPYPGRTNQEVLQFVTGGGRLDRPENCPGRIYKLMTCCWKKYGSERVHFARIVDVLAHVLENIHNSNRDSDDSDEDSDIDPGFERQPSRSSRTPSLRSGLMSIARQGSRLRNSFRRRSLHRKDFENPAQNCDDQFVGEGNQYYRERGPF